MLFSVWSLIIQQAHSQSVIKTQSGASCIIYCTWSPFIATTGNVYWLTATSKGVGQSSCTITEHLSALLL